MNKGGAGDEENPIYTLELVDIYKQHKTVRIPRTYNNARIQYRRGQEREGAGAETRVFTLFDSIITDGTRTNGPTNRWTEKALYRVAIARPKRNVQTERKQGPRGHYIVADKWAGASSPHSHPMPPSHTHMYAESI